MSPLCAPMSASPFIMLSALNANKLGAALSASRTSLPKFVGLRAKTFALDAPISPSAVVLEEDCVDMHLGSAARKLSFVTSIASKIVFAQHMGSAQTCLNALVRNVCAIKIQLRHLPSRNNAINVAIAVAAKAAKNDLQICLLLMV